MREVPKKIYRVIEERIDVWEADGDIDAALANRLRESVSPTPFDWLRAARVLLVGAVCCIFTGVVALSQEKLIRKIFELIFSAAPLARSAFFAFVAAFLYIFAARRRAKFPKKVFTNETFVFFGVLSTAAAVAWLGVALDDGSGRFSILFAIAAVAYAVVAFYTGSLLVWIFAVFSLTGWLGAETGYISGWGAYWLGMNYPARFVLWGIFLIAASYGMKELARARGFSRATLSCGLLCLFVSLWIMSVFGNYGDLDSWYKARVMELFHWSLLFAAAAGFALWLGIKRDDAMLRGYGLTFLGINIYTRYFENFWNSMNKGLFFIILGASLWYLGSKAEKIWNEKKNKKDEELK